MAKPKYSVDKKCRFYEKAHSYWLGRKRLISGTTFLKKIFPKFEAKEIAKNIAKGFRYRNRQKELQGLEVTELEKKKQTQKYWLNDWKAAASHGTNVHTLLEWELIELIENRSVIPEDTWSLFEPRTLNKYEQGKEWLQSYVEHEVWDQIVPEMIVYNEEIGVAGMIDLYVEKSDGTIDLIDWKTNKEIKKYGKKLEEPFSDLKDCNFDKYTMQLSLYAWMLEQQGKKIGKLILLHLEEDKYTEIEIEYKPEMIERIIEHDKTTN